MQELFLTFIQQTENQVISILGIITLAQSIALVYVLKYISQKTVHIRVWERTADKMNELGKITDKIITILENQS